MGLFNVTCVVCIHLPVAHTQHCIALEMIIQRIHIEPIGPPGDFAEFLAFRNMIISEA